MATSESDLLRLSMDDAVAVVRLKLPHITSPAAIERLSKALTTVAGMPHVRGVVIDFRRVELVTSPVFGILVNVRGLISKRGGVMALSRMSDDMKQVIRFIKLDRVVTLYDDIQAAVEACR